LQCHTAWVQKDNLLNLQAILNLTYKDGLRRTIRMTADILRVMIDTKKPGCLKMGSPALLFIADRI
jgi:hypothetical protein